VRSSAIEEAEAQTKRCRRRIHDVGAVHNRTLIVEALLFTIQSIVSLTNNHQLINVLTDPL